MENEWCCCCEMMHESCNYEPLLVYIVQCLEDPHRAETEAHFATWTCGADRKF